MMNVSRRIAIRGAVLFSVLVASAALAQQPVTAFGKQLERIDLGVSGIGIFNPDSSGTNYLPQHISQVPSNTFGALVQLRYTRSPLIGVELNYSQARFTENFQVTDIAGTPPSQFSYNLGVQSTAHEETLGYVAHAGNYFGIRPYAGAGVGVIEFRPTAGGGLSLPTQYRAAFYYAIGADGDISPHFGLRVQFRQVFYGAPDFNQNYFATGARVSTTEPGVGFYLRF
jgi:hypothetical protein